MRGRSITVRPRGRSIASRTGTSFNSPPPTGPTGSVLILESGGGFLLAESGSYLIHET